METRILRVPDDRSFGNFETGSGLERWNVNADNVEATRILREAGEYLRTKDTPVAFPTETVYGLGADATRSASVRGIYTAKNRPSDNPLISHVCDLEMLRDLLVGKDGSGFGSAEKTDDVIPWRYKSLIERFWPGPLTILLPNPSQPKLAPEVTAGLSTFGVRMPSSTLALSLIKLSGVPLAAPSANASTKPSPTTAQHVKHDLDGRIELILDGGACQVGVESTVVDGLSDPPAVLRPGGLSMDELRSCPGWENVIKGYKDHSENGQAPRAPGMKYKHYSPKATVVLYEASCQAQGESISLDDIESAYTARSQGSNGKSQPIVGVVRTQQWRQAAGLKTGELRLARAGESKQNGDKKQANTSYSVLEGALTNSDGETIGVVLDIDLGKDTRGIAQGLFSALRELDLLGADIIFVEGIEDKSDIAEAVMNRLRKAASDIRA
ncbi:hypothetical protein V2G26_014227 [Clonostachys chloroleuca]